MHEVHIGVANLVLQVRLVKWVRATDHMVHENASAPAVQRLAVRVVAALELMHFRCYVVGRTHHELSLVFALDHLRQSEVNDSHLPILVKQAVFGLQVPVHHIVAVHVVKSAQYHPHYAAKLIFFEQRLIPQSRVGFHLLNLTVDDLLQLGGFLEILHHDKQVVLVFIRFYILHNVWVVQHGQNSDFFTDHGHDLRVQILLEHDLYGVLHLRIGARLEQKDVREGPIAQALAHRLEILQQFTRCFTQLGGRRLNLLYPSSLL